MKPYHYTKTKEGFILMDGDRAIGTPTKRIAFLVDKDTGTLLRHGDIRLVEMVYRTYAEKYAQAGLYDFANALLVINVTDFELDHINQALDCTGFIRRFIEKATDTMWPRIHEHMSADDIKHLRGVVLNRRKLRQEEMFSMVAEEKYEKAAEARDTIAEWDAILGHVDFIEQSQKRLNNIGEAVTAMT